jgi:hypothetical protein
LNVYWIVNFLFSIQLVNVFEPDKISQFDYWLSD